MLESLDDLQMKKFGGEFGQHSVEIAVIRWQMLCDDS